VAQYKEGLLSLKTKLSGIRVCIFFIFWSLVFLIFKLIYSLLSTLISVKCSIYPSSVLYFFLSIFLPSSLSCLFFIVCIRGEEWVRKSQSWRIQHFIEINKNTLYWGPCNILLILLSCTNIIVISMPPRISMHREQFSKI